MDTKKIVFIECEGCEGSFTKESIRHYKSEWSEADLCDSCASAREAGALLADNGD